MQNNLTQVMIMGFIGKMGSGKTLNMSKWALLFSKNFNMPIYTNYHLKGAKYWEKAKELKNLENCIVCVDEIHVLFDSRDWDTKERYAFTHWFVQLRKRGIIFLYTTQRTDTLEKRIRNHTDFMDWCYKKKINKGNVFCVDNEITFIEKIYDTSTSLENAIYCKTLKTPETKIKWLYALYDTTETIKD